MVRNLDGQKVLLLNASNMDNFPVYPYAFIQVPAVARQNGIVVVCKDLLGIPHDQWEQTIKTLIEQDGPEMILITLRNTDSLSSSDYELDASKEGNKNAYFPIERTKELINVIRTVSDLKIVLGGFGFSLLPNELMQYLCPDFGVLGAADDFFTHFNDIKNGRYDNVPSLLYFQDGKLISNPRVFYSPLSDSEYTSQAIEEMMEFYASFPEPGFQGAPVEIMRGCNHSCVFCAEPISVGRKVRYRDISAVMKDIEILVNHNITKIYIISSELNPEGNEFILQLSDRIRSFSEQHAEGRKVTWYGANYLLNFTPDEYKRLYSSGFTGGWFDITALDDENARAMQTPYRNKRLLERIKTYAECKKSQLDRTQGKKKNQVESDELITWTMFLGNPAITIETIRNTLRIANQEGLSDHFDYCGIIGATRVFDYENLSKAALESTYSVTGNLERTTYQQLLPSFTYPPALLNEFSEKEIEEMFNHIKETYLSKKYRRTRNWASFVNERATVETISRWISELKIDKVETNTGAAMIDELFTKQQMFASKGLKENQAEMIVSFLVSIAMQNYPNSFEIIGLPSKRTDLERMTPYELTSKIFKKWELAEDLLEQTQSITPEWKRDLLRFCIQAILYRFNILIIPKYRQLFI